MYCTAEIAQLCYSLHNLIPYVYKKNVFQFEVPMQDILLVHMTDSFTNVRNDFSYTFLREMLVLVDEGPEVSICHRFHHHVEVVFVAEHVIQLYYILIVEIQVYLDLAEQILFILFILDVLLGDLLEGVDDSRVLVLGQINLSFDSLTYLLDDLEMMQLGGALISFSFGIGLYNRLNLILNQFLYRFLKVIRVRRGKWLRQILAEAPFLLQLRLCFCAKFKATFIYNDFFHFLVDILIHWQTIPSLPLQIALFWVFPLVLRLTFFNVLEALLVKESLHLLSVGIVLGVEGFPGWISVLEAHTFTREDIS